MRSRHLAPLLVLLTAGLGACSSEPSAPDAGAVSGQRALAPGTGTLGTFWIDIDPAQQTVALTPVRNGSSADVLEVVDISNYLAVSPCRDCVNVESIRWNGSGQVTLAIGIRHPFPAGDLALPISGANRADLHVFNVTGTLAGTGNATIYLGINEAVPEPFLLNADGYSGSLDAVLDPIAPSAATVHPYRLHFADYSNGNFNPAFATGFESVTTPGPSGHLVMAQGSGVDTRDYVLQLGTTPQRFVFAVGCSFGLSSANRAQRLTPEYRLPQYNQKAATEVRVAITSNGLAAGDASSSAQLEVQVVDVNHGVAVGPGLDQMLADSSVSSVSIEVPALMSTPVTLPGSASTGGTGHDPSDPLRYATSITNELVAIEGPYAGLVKVLDAYAVGQNSNPALGGNDGLGRVAPGEHPLGGLYGIAEFATFQTFTLDVGPVSSPLPYWETFMGDGGNTGNPGLPGPMSLFTAPSWNSGCAEWNCYGNPLPVFLDATTAYFSNTGDGGPLPAQAVDLATHTVKWFKQFDNSPQNWLNVKGISVTPSGTIVLCFESGTNHLYGLNGVDGSIAWDIPVWDYIMVDSYPALDLDGNFIIPCSEPIVGIDGRLGYASLDPVTGDENWFHPTPDPYYAMPAIGADGTIYATHGRSNGTLIAIDPATGDEKWAQPGLAEHRGNAVTVHPDGGILIHTVGGLWCYDDGGTSAVFRWSQPYACPFYSSSAVGPSGDIYALCYDGVLRRISPLDGATTASTSNWDDGYAARPAVSDDGILFFQVRRYDTNAAWYYAANADCTERWGYYAGAWIGPVGLLAAGALGQDGTLYTSQRNLGLVAFKDP